MLLGAVAALAQVPSQGVLREVYTDISGVSVSDLTNHPSFPNNPSSTNYLVDVFEAPTDILENYGQRVRGYVVAPQTGNYTFWIASDDGSTLFLSSDEQPVNRREIASVSSWTSSREWSKEPNQQSSAIPLSAGRRYYIEALMKEGGGGDNLAVRWQLPDGTVEEPIPGTRLIPFGVSFTPPIIKTQPTNVTAMEGTTASFRVEVNNLDPIAYQWQSNQVNLAGATGAELSLTSVPLAANGSRYRCFLTNSLGATNSLEATLTVTPDSVRPALATLLNIGTTNLVVTFSEPVRNPGAITPANYAIDGAVSVRTAVSGATPNIVILTTTPMTLGVTYTLTVNNVTDRAVTPNPVLPDTRMSFRALEYAPVEIGSPPVAGGATAAGNGYDVSGSGLDLGGTFDQFHFEYAQRSGNFDIEVRLASFTPTDLWAKAGLMARESLDNSARFVASIATPGSIGCFMMARSSPGTAAAINGRLPANYPETWLRLQRGGNVFTAFASYDGQNWVTLGSSTLALPSTLYVGTAVTSRSQTESATVQFRDYAAGSGVVLNGPTTTPDREPMGPSTRRTGLVFSEIMYHPAPRPDTNSLEFIEVHNAGMIFEDLTGFRISGAVDFAFPAGTKLPAGGVIVIARSPQSIHDVYGLHNVLGPYTGSLGNRDATLRLRDELDSVLLEVPYSDASPWPLAADGTGHSLVLTRPSYGESNPMAWSASDQIGGSPGTLEPVRANPWANVMINEFLAHTDDPIFDFIELYNHGNSPVNLSGCFLSDDVTTNKFRIPDGTIIPGRGFLSYDQNELGFSLKAEGDTLYFVSSNTTRVLDIVKFAGQQNGIATGRSPDGAATFRVLTTPTPKASNAAFGLPDIVINEVMYAPISNNNDDEYVELYNRGQGSVDLSGWRFTSGISYRIPTNTVLSAGGYLVVARNAARLLTNYPGLTTNNTVGNFDGTLANSGEHLVLSKPDEVVSTNRFDEVVTNTIWILVSEVAYGTGGRWPGLADGGGSSLELVDANSDTLQPANWSASNETTKAPWTTIDFTGVMDNGNGDFTPDLQMALQGAGECLVDDVEVRTAGGANRVFNPGFSSGVSGWVFQGNHTATTLEPSGGVSGACLHVRASGRGDTGANRIYSLLPDRTGLNEGATVTLRAKVRWLSGWPEFLLRLRGNWIEAPKTLALPSNLGTPGARNSRAISNAGPAIYDVAHSPILPASAQPVVVTARASDPGGVSRLDLYYREDGISTFSSTRMLDNGTGGDAIANDGIYSATLTGRSAGVMVCFYIQATDGSSTASRFPADAPTRECLVRWGEGESMSTIANYRLWQRQTEVNTLYGREPLSNDPLDCTFVYGNTRVIYNAQVRSKGSPWHSGSVGSDWVFNFPDDNLFLGGRDMAVVSIGNLGSDDSGQREQAAYWIMRKLGNPYLNRRYVRFLWNGSQAYPVHEDSQEPSGEFTSQWFPDDSNGDLHKIEDWFEFADDGRTFSPRDATLQKFTTTGGQIKLARYRWDWRKRAVQDSSNNYTNLFNLVEAANLTTTNYTTQLLNQADIEQWMRCFMVQHIVGNWDAYGYNRGKNCYAYKPIHGRWHMIPWDIDFVLGSGGDGPSTDIFGTNDPTIWQMYNEPTFQRACWRAIRDACDGPLKEENFGPLLDAKWREFAANGLAFASPTAIKSWINSRRTYLLSRLAGVSFPFAVTTGGGGNLNTTKNLITLTGTAPVEISTIEVNGVTHSATWSALNTWSISLPLPTRTNALLIKGRDLRGNEVSGATWQMTVTYTGTVQLPQDYVVINEINYNPAVPGTSFIEIHNTSALTTFDLSGWRLDGVGFTFPEGVVIQPGGFVVVAANATSFAKTYGLAVIPVGEFPGTLDNGGETLKLVQPGATPAQDTLIDMVRFDDDLPWPGAADGFGPSLQLIDASKDNWRPANWTTTATNAVIRATPGTTNSVRATLAAIPPLWINEVQPENLSGPVDSAGDRDPWIELFNSGTAAVSLNGLYLSASYTNLTQWAFPANLTLQPGQFLLVFADGETAESTSSEPHTNFRLTAGTGQVALSRLQSGSPVALDYLSYTLLSPGLSFGSFPDGHPESRTLFHLPSARATNDISAVKVSVFINEWMASNVRAVADPADGDYEDWFELYNAGTDAVDLSAYTLTDTLTNRTKFTIPAGTILPAGGYLLVWADEETGQNGRNADLHANFKLSGSGEALGLFAPDGTTVHALTFAAQTNDVSQGSYPEGQTETVEFLQSPSPRGPNIFNTSNRAPQLAAIGNRTISEGSILSFTATATDPDTTQVLTFSLGTGAPAGAAIDPQTGLFIWEPGERDGPGIYPISIVVTDNGLPPRRASETISVNVQELNRPPILTALNDATVDEGSLLSFTAAASDPDIPANTLAFSLAAGAPVGASIDPLTGVFSWRPTELQGGNDYTVAINATDNGTPAQTATASFHVRVNKVNNAPRLQNVPSQSIDEGSPFSLTVSAIDPDLPPDALSYTLEGEIPSGLQFDASTGTMHWTPTEAQGPASLLLTVRATESSTVQHLSDSISFTLVVREVNQPPVVEPIPDFTVSEGEIVSFSARGADPDLPAQTLAWSLEPGAPAAATIDPASGAFRWAVDRDQGAGTNRITVRVLDGGSPSLGTTASFNVVVHPVNHVVINEIMHHPAAANAAYIELVNNSKVTPADLSGCRLDPVGITFPAGTVLPPGAFGLAVQNRDAFVSAYGNTTTVLGEFTSPLNADGANLQLLRPGSTPGTFVLLDEVAFSSALPWPATALTGGASLQLIDADEDNNHPWNWDVGSQVTTNAPTPYLAITDVWRYDQSGVEPTPDWTSAGYNDSGWSRGAGLLYVESAALPAPKSTPLALGPMAYHFRTQFTYAGNPTGATLILNTVIDDGVVIYLNGTPIFRLGMDDSAPTQNMPANRTVSDAVFEGPFRIPVDNLRVGENVLAAEVHQINATSTDVCFGLTLDIEELRPSAFTPGAANSVRADLPPAPAITINEILPANLTGAMDSRGERDPWIELHNAGDEAAALDGWFLTDDFSNLGGWGFPAGATVPAHGFLLVWADGQPAQGSAAEPHTSFRLSGLAGQLALSRMQNSKPGVVDYLGYAVAGADVPYGAPIDGDYLHRTALGTPTPAAANSTPSQDTAPVLGAIQVETDGTVTFSWASIPGRTYRVEFKNQVEAPAWELLQTVFARGETVGAADTEGRTRARRFYRVLLVP